MFTEMNDKLDLKIGSRIQTICDENTSISRSWESYDFFFLLSLIEM